MITKEELKSMRECYTPAVIPPCRVCGGELSPQRMGGGEPTVYACSTNEDDPKRPGYVRPKEGRDIADKHYSDSRFVDRINGDRRVLELIDVYESVKVKIKRAYPVEFDVLFVPICQVCGYANHRHTPAKMKKCLNEYAEGDE